MNRFYLVPAFTVDSGRGRIPKYFAYPRLGIPGITGENGFGSANYGFIPYFLVISNLTVADHSFLSSQIDVYTFPENLDDLITDPSLDIFFESIHIPTDWLTPSTTYRELLRNTMGMIQFQQKYQVIGAEITGENVSLFDNVTLDDAYRDFTTTEKLIFDTTLDWFRISTGIDIPKILPNQKFRLIVKSAATLWENSIFYLGGVEF